jgi:hypothetical protein
MEDSMADCIDELVSTENLKEFSVVESYCEVCGDLTPHHIDESVKQTDFTDARTIFVPPISIHECVSCREEEEMALDQETP